MNHNRDLIDQIQKLLKKRGIEALKIARREILREKIECKEVTEALNYFMNKYWHVTARPGLLSIVCEAAGGDPATTLPITVPLILVSGGIDIHDDIIDQSKIKWENRCTVFGKFGKEIALLVGDALIFKGFSLLLEAGKVISAEKMHHVNRVIHSMFFELGDAQALELKLKNRLDVTPEEYIDVIIKKASDVEADFRIGAILADLKKREVNALGRYGRLLGMIIIIGEDYIDVFDPEELGNRIKNECLPLPIIYTLQNSDARCKFKSLILKNRTDKILEFTEKEGGFAKTEETMQKLANRALPYLGRVKTEDNTLRKLLEATLLAVKTSI